MPEGTGGNSTLQLAPETPAVWHLQKHLPSVVGDCTNRDLSAQISAQLSCRLKVSKRLDAARTVCKFQYCCKSTVPLTRKMLVFNEVLLLALEVCMPDDTDLLRLEPPGGSL